MFQLVRQYGTFVDPSGGVYQARAYGEPQADGWWGGWLVFFPLGAGTAVATDRETTQSSFADLVRWSSTIGPVYLQGALERALLLLPEAMLSDRLAELALLEREAADEAAVLETAAARARAESNAAEREAIAHEQAAAVARAEAEERADAARAMEDAEIAIDAPEIPVVIEQREPEASGATSRKRKPRSQAADATRSRRAKTKRQ
jgi:hypothetical protein